MLTDTLPSGLRFTEWITPSVATLNGSTISWGLQQLYLFVPSCVVLLGGVPWCVTMTQLSRIILVRYIYA